MTGCEDPGRSSARYDAIVLAGGGASRLGGVDKAAIVIGAGSLLDRVLAAVDGADRVIVVGPVRPVERCAGELVWCQESPAGGGPAAAVAAALPHTGADLVAVLAVDQPWIAPAVAPLLDALTDGAADVAVLIDPTGRLNYLAAIWRRPALASAIERLERPSGTPMRALFASVRRAEVPDAGGWGEDCDTPEDVARSRRRVPEEMEQSS